MKIETNTIVEFLKKIRMEEIEECLLQFKEEGLYISTISTANTNMVKGLLKKESFEEYEEIGNVGVDDLKRLTDVMKRLGKQLNFTVEGNMLTIKNDKKELNYELVDEKYIKVYDKEMNPEMKTEFKIDASKIKEFLEDAKINKEIEITLETVNEGIILSSKGKYRFKHMIDVKDAKEGERVTFAQPFINVFNELKEGELTLKVRTDYPLLIKQETEKYNIEFIIAPFVSKK